MSDNASFCDLIRRVRAGDAAACEELVRRYEPAIRVAVHVRLTDPSLRRVLDSMDVCQSVLASFFARAALGQFDLDTPARLVRLLQKMACNRLINHVRKERADKRDGRRVARGADQGQIADPQPDPSQVVAGEELLREFRKRLSPHARWTADQLALDQSWDRIGAESGVPANTARMRYRRELKRIASELGLDE